MEKKDATFELPFANGSVIPKIQQKNNYVPDQPLGWQGTMEYPPLFEPMQEDRKRDKKKRRCREKKSEERKKKKK